MAGIHIISRTTKPNKYMKIETELVLPQWVSGDNLVKPEYIIGFYKSLGLDIGICYEDGEFQLFYWSLKGTCDPQGETERVILGDVGVGDTLKLVATLESTSVVLKVYKSGRLKGTMTAPLTSRAISDFSNGCYINRELVIASNAKGDYTPRNVYTYNAKFDNGKVTKVSGRTYSLNNSNSKISHELDPDDRYIKVSECKYADCSDGYDWEKGSCDLNKK